MLVFSENLVFWKNTRFEIRPLGLSPTKFVRNLIKLLKYARHLPEICKCNSYLIKRHKYNRYLFKLLTRLWHECDINLLKLYPFCWRYIGAHRKGLRIFTKKFCNIFFYENTYFFVIVLHIKHWYIPIQRLTLLT